ncbi:ATP-binding protein [Acinetobacter baumannii]|nr:ATP-binding protein [Acinetobacter baumannii]MDC4929255.1 ATP-binding protein [Acinetobacter baumannii]MDC4967459.1 ATP-binding protein [Acinetobacter baumannii]
MAMNSIKANPTKEFFITMLTRDIPLDRAILDLIDNSVDAANSNGLLDKISSQPDDHQHLEADLDLDQEENEIPTIRITFSTEKFEIIDNCGGMPIEIAKNYAFRFGRPLESPLTPNSVGQFGVGMKRTLFKLGKNFIVQSKYNSEDGFKIAVDVDQWKSDDKSTEWEFSYELDTSAAENSTKINVEGLYPQISKLLGEAEFENSLIRQISQSHFKCLRQGLRIFINNKRVKPYPITFYDNDEISPTVIIKDLDGVEVKIIAGISERNFHKGGWYIVCNGRLVVAAEQSAVSGWDTDDIRKYHPDAAFFRGIVEFNCQDSSKLPWTTTKTGIDTDNATYRKALIYMKDAMRQILSYLNNRVKEAKYLEEKRINDAPLVTAISNSKPKLVTNIQVPRALKIPKANLSAQPSRETRIQYLVDTDKYEKVSATLGIDQRNAVGLKTFEYYYSYEVGNE